MATPDPVKFVSSDLRRLTTLIGALTAFFGALLIAIIAHTGWSSNQAATETERTLLKNAFDQSIARALNEQKSVAWWDDAVLKISDSVIDMDFVDSNFGIFLTETYGHDEVYILNGDNHPVYAFLGGKRDEASLFQHRRASLESVIEEARGGRRTNLTVRPDRFSEAQSNYRVLVGAVQTARWAGHILSVDGRPAVVAALTIVPNVDMSLLKGTPYLLVSVTYIDEAFISEVGRSLLLGDLALTSEAIVADGLVSEPLIADDGVPEGHLSWKTRQPGRILLTIILPLVALGILSAGFFSRTMLVRLRRTSEELARSELQARHESKHDSLSGLPNRAHMTEKIESFLQAHSLDRAGQRAIAAYLDIDRFKDVNDTLGHEAGDQLVKLVAQRLKDSLRAEDFLSRFGGDEFVILCAPTNAGAVAPLTERIAQAFASPFSINGQRIKVTASVGIAVGPDNGSTADALMRHADIALYEAKNRGRDQAVVFSTEMAQQVEQRRAIELDLQAALENEMLFLHYQPVVSCGSGHIVGLEALLRWRHPVHGDMSPAVFIPIAENAGLLPSLGEWVLNRAMQDSKLWPHLQISVNLSPVQFRHVDLETTLRKLVAEHGVKPSRFVLEITEGVLLEATDHTNSTLDALRSIGFRTALDDFGTGYSSLAYLCNFKFDKIKIDRSFVGRISRIDIARTIVQAVVSIGRGLGMVIVAEGVETEFEAMMMTRLGCTEMQGYYFSKPVSSAQITELIDSFQPKRIVTPSTTGQAKSVSSAAG